jgi:hypothetical protein
MLLILALLLLLDHPRWAVRVGAERCLTPANAVTLPLLEAREKVGPAEGARRAHWLVNDYYRRHADRLSRTLGSLPKIQFLPSAHPGLHDAIDDRLEGAYRSLGRERHVGRQPFFWDNHGRDVNIDQHDAAVLAEATRLLIRDRIAARLPVAELLEEMRANERKQMQGD